MRKSFSDGRFVLAGPRVPSLPSGYFWRIHATPVRHKATYGDWSKFRLGINGKTGYRDEIKKFKYISSVYPDYRDRWLANYVAWLMERGWTVPGICRTYSAARNQIASMANRKRGQRGVIWRTRLADWRKKTRHTDDRLTWPEVAQWNCCHWDWRRKAWRRITIPSLTKLLDARAAGWPLYDGKPLDVLAAENAAAKPKLSPAAQKAKDRLKPIVPCAVSFKFETPIGAPKLWNRYMTWPMLRIHDLGWKVR